ALSGMRTALDEIFLLVVVGEYNAGKSTLINCLLGDTVLEVGDLPTTREVHLLRHGEVRGARQLEPGLVLHQHPAERLRELCIVDTPGTNSMQRREEELTERFVPRADLVLFLTSLRRPYAASEHDFISRIRAWGKKVVFVVSHADLQEEPGQIERVKDYVREQAGKGLDTEPRIFAVSARQVVRARQGKAEIDPANEWEKLEGWLRETLAPRERVLGKLRAPLDTLGTILARQSEALAERRALVEGDRTAMNGILDDVDSYEKRMREEVSRYQSGIENTVLKLERRGHRFLDDTVRLGNLFRLRNTDVIENRFRNEVIADTAARIEEEVQALIDWLVRENLAAWDRAQASVEERRAALLDAAARTKVLTREAVYNREEIFENLAKPVRRYLEAFDPRAEADRVVAAVTEAVARTFGVEAVVVGIGAVLTAAFTSLTIDVTGAVGATILLLTGLFLLPHRRGRLKRELSTRVETLKEELSESVERSFVTQVERYAAKLREVFTPERDAADARARTLADAQQRLERLEERRRELREPLGN
ncbi:dynamin family protein, partial [bacterium]|nr:dynamin family protein [bacterium]